MEKNIRCGATRRRSWIIAAAAALAAAGAASPSWAQQVESAGSTGRHQNSRTRAAQWLATATPQQKALYAFAQATLHRGTRRNAMGLPLVPKEAQRFERDARRAARNAPKAVAFLIEALATEARQTRDPIGGSAPTDEGALQELFHGHATRAIVQRTAAVAVPVDRVPGAAPQDTVMLEGGLADGVRLYLSARSNGQARTPSAAGGDAQSTGPKHGKKPSKNDLRIAAATMARNLMDSHIDKVPFGAVMFPGTERRTEPRSEPTPGTDE